MAKIRKTRSDSKMQQLPKEVLEQVNAMLLDDNKRYADIQEWLETEQGLKISLSSISNYAVKVYTGAQRIAGELERTKSLLEYVGSKSLNPGEAATTILTSALLERVASAEDEYKEIPIEKAGRLLVQLSKNALEEGKFELLQKSARAKAFDEFEDQMMESLKRHPDLKDRFKHILIELKAREGKE